jgi:CrcB protein
MMLFKNILLVGFGGMTGSVLRYITSLTIRHDSFPYATWIVNISGSLLMGMIMGVAAKQGGSDNWRLFLATGICGGFTTFSAFAWENLQLLQQQRYPAFVLYTSGSLLLGLLAVALGYWLTK